MIGIHKKKNAEFNSKLLNINCFTNNEQNKMKMMKIITQIMSIFLFLAIAVSVALLFLSCNTPKQEEVVEDNALPWPEHFLEIIRFHSGQPCISQVQIHFFE